MKLPLLTLMWFAVAFGLWLKGGDAMPAMIVAAIYQSAALIIEALEARK